MRRIQVITTRDGTHEAWDSGHCIASTNGTERSLRDVWDAAIEYFSELDSATLERVMHYVPRPGQSSVFVHTVAGRTPYSEFNCQYL